jgi:hypothetical protein
MQKPIKAMPKKRRGRPATGKDPQVVVRMPAALIAEVDAWAATNDAIRSEAVRRLVELGLTVKARPKQDSRARAERAKEMAAETINDLADPHASTEEKANRKRRLLKGPEEFRGVRVDRAKKEK